MNSIHIRALVNEDGWVEVQLPEQLHGKLLDLVVVYEPMPEGEQEGATPPAGWPAGLYEATAGAWQGEPLLREPQGEYEERDISIVSGLEALQSVQFVTLDGRRLAVMDGGDWDALVEWLENIEDVHAARQAYQILKEAGGDRDKAGWLRWDEIEGELD